MKKIQENIPVVIIHKGLHRYVQVAINQAKFFANDVSVISDKSFKNCLNYDIDKYSNFSKKFAKYYIHLSSTTVVWVELFCFQRWFVLYEFMKEQKIDKVFCMDSDVLLYTDASEDFKNYKNFIFTLSHESSGGNSYFTLNGIKRFCDFLIEAYRKKNIDFVKVVSTGYVNDTSFLRYYARYKYPNKIGEMTEILNGAVYDGNINVSGGYEFDKIKQFRFKNKIPYCYNSKLKKDIRFKCIHFGGYERKMLMGQYATYVNYNFLDKSEKIQKILLILKTLEKSKKFKMYKYGVVAILLWEVIQFFYSKLF